MPIISLIILLALFGGFGYCAFQILWRIQAAWGWYGTAPVALGILAAGAIAWRRLSLKVACQAKRTAAEEAREGGDFDACERLLVEGLHLASSSKEGGGANQAVLHWDLSDLYAELERYDESLGHLQSAIAAAQGSSSPYARQIRECGPQRMEELSQTIAERQSGSAGGGGVADPV